MYTGFKIKAKIKPQFIGVIRTLHYNINNDDNGTPIWTELAQQYPQYQWIQEWSKVDRASFIPCGWSAYFDDPYWQDENGKFPYTKFDNEVWEFSCNLKNYENEIAYFIYHVLFNIVEIWYDCRIQYESCRFDQYDGSEVEPEFMDILQIKEYVRDGVKYLQG